MFRIRNCALLLLLPFLVSCGGGGGGGVTAAGGGRNNSGGGSVGNPPPYTGVPDPGDVEETFGWRPLFSWPNSFTDTPWLTVARTDAEYEAIWRLCDYDAMNPERPKVDLDREMVIAVFLGAINDRVTCEITNISERGDGVDVAYVRYVPGPAYPPPLPTAWARPYAVAAVTRKEGAVTFTETVQILP